MNRRPPWIAWAMVLALTGCYGMGMAPSSNQAGSPVNAFLRPDGSTMFFVQGLKWSADDSSDELTMDITLHTAKERCDSSVCQVSWMSVLSTPPADPIMNLTSVNASTVGRKMYRERGRKITEHRYEFVWPTAALVSWLEADEAECTFMGQTWTLRRSGQKARNQASFQAFDEWREACGSSVRP